MKKIITTLAIASLVTLTGCGSATPETGNGTPVDSTEVSAEMQDFMDMFNGKASGTQEALENNVVAELSNHDMGNYNLENPIVTDTKGDCYTMEAQYSTFIRVYDICWKDGKINEIDFSEEREA